MVARPTTVSEQLAESIRGNGLVQPIVLDANYNLVAGGRRYQALKLLGVTELFHATTSDPERPGFVLKGEDEHSTLSNILSEIAENLARQDLDWRDQLNLIVRAYRLATSEASVRGEEVLKQDFALMIDVDYQELKAAIAIYEDVKANPERYETVSSIRGAYAELLKENARYVSSLAAKKTLPIAPPPSVDSLDHEQPRGLHAPPREVSINLSTAFHHTDGLEFLAIHQGDCFDHIVTDPDYAIDVEVLNSNMEAAASGVHQPSVENSLRDLETFIELAYGSLKPQGFCVFFYDLDHHEKLQLLAKRVGFRVQRWPLIWKKPICFPTPRPSTTSPKTWSTLWYAGNQRRHLCPPRTSCVFECGSANTVKTLGHPFAKPLDLWRWIYNAITIEGQIVCDPFVGCGSSAVAAIRQGLRPIGCEINVDWYNLLLINLQAEYTKLVGGKVNFT